MSPAAAIDHLVVAARTLAEGVETDGQLEFLRAQGCDEGQGYLFAKPLPVAQLADWVKTGSREGEGPGFSASAFQQPDFPRG